MGCCGCVTSMRAWVNRFRASPVQVQARLVAHLATRIVDSDHVHAFLRRAMVDHRSSSMRVSLRTALYVPSRSLSRV